MISQEPYGDKDRLALFTQRVRPNIEWIRRVGQLLKVGREHGSCILRFLDEWMSTLPAGYRKALSHVGACRAVNQMHPTHYEDPVLGRMFDPGNLVYEVVLKFAIGPKLLASRWWNQEKLGDACEAWLAVGLSQGWALALWVEAAAAELYLLMAWYPHLQSYDDFVQLGEFAWRIRGGCEATPSCIPPWRKGRERSPSRMPTGRADRAPSPSSIPPWRGGREASASCIPPWRRG